MKKPKFPTLASLEAYRTEGAFGFVEKLDHRTVGIWALECADRVMPYFEKAYPNDSRPRDALKALQDWIITGAFNMRAFRLVALPSHAAAKEVGNDSPAASVAHAAGQAAGTAHGPAHAFGAANYALQAIYRAIDDLDEAEAAVVNEREWQLKRLRSFLKAGEGDNPSSKVLWRG